jgi:hypothetical protein
MQRIAGMLSSEVAHINGWTDDPHARRVAKISLESSLEVRNLSSLPLPFKCFFESVVANDGISECEESPAEEPLVVPRIRRRIVILRSFWLAAPDQFRKGRSSALWIFRKFVQLIPCGEFTSHFLDNKFAVWTANLLFADPVTDQIGTFTC